MRRLGISKTELGKGPSKALFLISAKSNENHPSKLSRIVPTKLLPFNRRIPEEGKCCQDECRNKRRHIKS